jgi:hypothetical protein
MKVKIIGAVALLALLACPAPCGASYDPVAGGSVKLSLDPAFASLMKRAGVTLTAKAPAKKKGKAITLPVSGGRMDPTTGKGEALGEGTLFFQRGNRKVPLRNIEAKAKTTPLYAKVGGSQLKVAKAKSVSAKREGFGQGFSAKPLTLTQKVATRLNKKLGVKDAFAEGQVIGALRVKSTPQLVTILPQGRGTLTPDPQILAKFRSLFVSLNPISPAELSPGPLFSFPIAAGGAISPEASQGTLRFGGAIELLQLGAGQVFHSEYWLDLGSKATSAEVEILPTPAFPGKLGRIGVFGLDMAGAQVSTDPKARAISLAGATLRLDAATAQSFNEAFAGGSPAFVAGEAFGAVGFGAVGQ